MVRVAISAADPDTAWRVRDALASHPLLGGATAQITVIASQHCVVLEGWTVDDQVKQLAIRLARRAAGRCVVQMQLYSCSQQPQQQVAAKQADIHDPESLTEC